MTAQVYGGLLTSKELQCNYVGIITIMCFWLHRVHGILASKAHDCKHRNTIQDTRFETTSLIHCGNCMVCHETHNKALHQRSVFSLFQITIHSHRLLSMCLLSRCQKHMIVNIAAQHKIQVNFINPLRKLHDLPWGIHNKTLHQRPIFSFCQN